MPRKAEISIRTTLTISDDISAAEIEKMMVRPMVAMLKKFAISKGYKASQISVGPHLRLWAQND